MNRINLLMATYNGEKYLKEQIESIINQSFNRWELLIRDDCSNDNTLNILNRYKKKDKRIKLINDEYGCLGVAKNFEKLLEQSTAKYIMFVDQDDFWFENKIETLYNNIVKLEQKHSESTPILVHSDATIVDEKLNVIKKKFIGKRGNLEGLNKIIFSPVVQGSSMIINNALKKNILPFPKNLFLHDFYISVVNEIIGVRKYMNKPLMYYRQHSGNEIGFDNSKLNKFKKMFSQNFLIANENQKNTIQSIYKRFSHKMTDIEKEYLKKFCYITNINNNKLIKVYYILRYGFRNIDGALPLIIKTLLNND